MTTPTRLCFILLFTSSLQLGTTSCTSHKEPPQIQRLEAKLTNEEKELAKIEEKMKDPTTETGEKAQLASDRELLLSRIARIRESLDEMTRKATAKSLVP